MGDSLTVKAPRLRLAAPKKLESEIQREIIAYLRHEQASGRIGVFWRINGGASRYRGGRPVKNYRLWIPCCDESSEGMSDIFGQLGPNSDTPGRGFALEVKRPGESMDDNQHAFATAIRASGGMAGMVRSWQEARLFLFGEKRNCSSLPDSSNQ